MIVERHAGTPRSRTAPLNATFPPVRDEQPLLCVCVNVGPFMRSPQTSFSPLALAGRSVSLCGVGEFLTKLEGGTPIREHVWVEVPETAGGKGPRVHFFTRGLFLQFICHAINRARRMG